MSSEIESFAISPRRSEDGKNERGQRHATFTLISTLSKEKVPAVGLMREDKNSQPARDGFPEEQRTGRGTGVCDASGLPALLSSRANDPEGGKSAHQRRARETQKSHWAGDPEAPCRCSGRCDRK